jgi:hypothetical protein
LKILPHDSVLKFLVDKNYFSSKDSNTDNKDENYDKESIDNSLTVQAYIDLA